MGGNLQEGVALGSRDASYFESTVTAGGMRGFQASWDGRTWAMPAAAWPSDS